MEPMVVVARRKNPLLFNQEIARLTPRVARYHPNDHEFTPGEEYPFECAKCKWLDPTQPDLGCGHNAHDHTQIVLTELRRLEPVFKRLVFSVGDNIIVALAIWTAAMAISIETETDAENAVGMLLDQYLAPPLPSQQHPELN